MNPTASTTALPSASVQASVRRWATPLTIASFGLMAVTGVLMFFHWDTPLQKSIHSWLGWGLLAAVVLHGWMNWFGLKRHFLPQGRARWLVGLAALALGISLLPLSSGGPSAPGIAIQALARAPLAQVAPLFGKTPDDAVRALAAAGLPVTDAGVSIGRLANGDRELVGRALQALSAPAAPAAR